jgi:hypothetical protein
VLIPTTLSFPGDSCVWTPFIREALIGSEGEIGVSAQVVFLGTRRSGGDFPFYCLLFSFSAAIVQASEDRLMFEKGMHDADMEKFPSEFGGVPAERQKLQSSSSLSRS